MKLTTDQILLLAVLPTDPEILTMRLDCVRYRRNYFGEKFQDYLSKINNYENDEQYQLRKKFAESNASLVENLLRPLDNIFSAKGGVRSFELDAKSDSDFRDKLNNVRSGMSMVDFMRDVFTEQLMTNPGGMAFIEPKANDPKVATITIKSVDCIKNYSLDGIKPEYVVFEFDQYEDKNNTVKLLWIVDDFAYYRLRITKGETKQTGLFDSQEKGEKKPEGKVLLEIAEIIETKAHNLKQVPGVVFSPLTDSRRKVKISPIHNQIEKLDLYCYDNSVKQIYQAKHGFPIFWSYVTACPVCKGTRVYNGNDCPACSGTGVNMRKDVSDVMYLKLPNDDDGIKVAPDVAGFVQPDLETWQEMRIELKDKYNLIYYSHWGTVEEKSDNETATGRFIDVQPVNNKLNRYADIFENGERILTNLIGVFYYPSGFKQSHISYGRRFLIETPDQIWDKYLNAKKGMAPSQVLDLLLEQYYESEYRKNEVMLGVMLKRMKLEPFVHSTIEEVNGWTVDDDVKAQKIWFSEWIKEVEQTELIAKSVDDLKKMLIEYADSKTDGKEVITKI